LFHQSGASDFVYEILSGTVDIVREYADGTSVVIATRSAPAYVGELGPMLGFPRSATVVAQGPTKLLRLTTEQFRLRHAEQT